MPTMREMEVSKASVQQSGFSCSRKSILFIAVCVRNVIKYFWFDM